LPPFGGARVVALPGGQGKGGGKGAPPGGGRKGGGKAIKERDD